MKTLLTGAAGFIGSHVAQALEAAGHEVVGLDVRTGGDVREPAVLDRLLPGVDAVVHQAAKVGLGVDVADLPDYASVNVYGTAVLLAAMARHGVGRLVLASSMVVYGEGAYDCARHGGVPAGPRGPRDLDARAVRAARARVAARSWRPGRSARTPRSTRATPTPPPSSPRSTWPPAGRARPAAPRWRCATTTSTGRGCPATRPTRGWRRSSASALEAGRAPRVFEDGGQRRDFVHVTRRRPGEPRRAGPAGAPGAAVAAYNVASGRAPHGRRHGRGAGASGGGPTPVITGEYRLGDVRHIVALPDLAAKELGFHARIGFAEGMREFADAPLA